MNELQRKILTKYKRAAKKQIFLDTLTMRPFERELYKMLLKAPYNQPLREGRIVSGLIEEEIIWGIEHEGHLLAQIFGVQGSGKSMVALKIAKIIQREWRKKGKEVSIYLTYDFNETIRIFRDVEPGDIIVQDEAPSLSGMESRNVVKAIQNLQATMRERQISWIFAYPVVIKTLVNPTMLLEVIGYWEEKRWTLVVAYSRFQRVLGWGIFDVSEVLEDKSLMSYYRKRKSENLDRLQRTLGYAMPASGENIIEDAERVLEQWRLYDGPKDVKSLSDVKKFIYLANIQGSQDYKTAVAKIAFDMIIREKQKMETTAYSRMKGETIDELNIDFLKVNFRKYLYEQIKDMKLPPYKIDGKFWITFKKIIEYVAEKWGYNDKILNREELSKKLGYSTWMISESLMQIAGSGFVGEIFEKFWHKLFKVPWKGRAKQDEPDFVHPKTGIPFSLKTSLSLRAAARYRTEDFRPELKYANQHNKKYFYFAFANPLWQAFPLVLKFEVDNPPKIIKIPPSFKYQVFYW